MDLGSRRTRTKERRKKVVEALNRMLPRLGATSVELWVITLMIARRERVATSVGKQVTRLLSARRRLLATIVVRRSISVLSVPIRRRRRGRCLH
jgi:hypothetical protein